MTRADGLFHLALAGILVFGGLFADQIGSAMWDSLNQGVRAAYLLGCWDRIPVSATMLRPVCNFAEGL